MMTLIAAAALAAQAPAAPAADPMAQHANHAQHQPADKKGMDCCKDCCTEMAAKHEGHGPDHAEHGSQ